MGAYLTKPKTEKLSSDESNEYLLCGASSMQGWRQSQEDAHNCTLKFDKNSSLFAVYDGHGGAEVALYCADNLPTFLRQTEAYLAKNYDQALKDAFIGFDATLIQDDIQMELQKLNNSTKTGLMESETEEDVEDVEDADINELNELRQEGQMPLDEVLERYHDVNHKKNPILAKLKKGEIAGGSGGAAAGSSSASGSKPISPYLRGARGVKQKCTTDDVDASAAGSSSSRKLVDDEGVSSSSSKQQTTADEKVDCSTKNNGTDSALSATASSAVSTSETIKDSTPDSSSTCKLTTNGEVSESTPATNGNEQENKISTNCNSTKISENVTSSSTSSTKTAAGSSSTSTKVENGQVTGSALPSLDDSSSSTEDDNDATYNDEKSSSTDDGEDCEMESDEDDKPIFGEEDDGDDEEDDEHASDDEEEEEDDDEDDEADNAFLNEMIEGPASSSGCTAVVALLVERDLYVANAGDSRCVVCRNGEALEMSIDHKPEDNDELERIQNAGGRVTMDGRVNGGLNLSRAIGDHAYKMNKDLKPEQQMISALPDIKKITITDKDEFMIIACDGIWNFLTSEQVVKFVRERLAENREKISTICEELFMKCLAKNTIGDGTGCDNMTAVIVQFKPKLLSDFDVKIDDAVAKDEEQSIDENNRKRVAGSPISDGDENLKKIKTDDATNDEDEKAVASLAAEEKTAENR